MADTEAKTLTYKSLTLKKLVELYESLDDTKKSWFNPNDYVETVASETEMVETGEFGVNKNNKIYKVKKRQDKKGAGQKKVFAFYKAKADFYKIYFDEFPWEEKSESLKKEMEQKKLLEKLGVSLDISEVEENE